jgi:hypothetical protein
LLEGTSIDSRLAPDVMPTPGVGGRDSCGARPGHALLLAMSGLPLPQPDSGAGLPWFRETQSRAAPPRGTRLPEGRVAVDALVVLQLLLLDDIIVGSQGERSPEGGDVPESLGIHPASRTESAGVGGEDRG